MEWVLSKTQLEQEPSVAEGGLSRQAATARGLSPHAARLAAVLPFLICLPLFCWFAWQKAEKSNSGIAKNNEHAMFDYDQHSYLNMGRLMKEQGYQKTVPRHRMPGYSFLMSWLHWESDAYPIDPTGKDPRGVSEGYFMRAKVFNIFLGCLSLVGLYLICRRFMPIFESHLVTWSFGWLVAVIRVPYVQPEPIFYVLFLWAVVLLWRILARPRWWMIPLAALALAAAYILKSSVVPLIALFLGCALIQAGWHLWTWLRERPRDPGHLRMSLAGLGRAALVPVIFTAVLFPYFKNTAAMHGSPLWDVHSRHYLWMDSDEDKRFWRQAGIANPGFVPPVGREVPTVATYLRDHSWPEMVQRLKTGWYDIKAMIKARYRGAYEMTRKWCLPVLLGLCVVGRRRSWEVFRTRSVEGLMVTGFFIGFTLLYCWYQAIGVGPRLIMALFLPALFFLVLGIHRLSEGMICQIGKRRIVVRHVLNAVMLGLLIFQTGNLLRGDYWVIEGGR